MGKIYQVKAKKPKVGVLNSLILLPFIKKKRSICSAGKLCWEGSVFFVEIFRIGGLLHR